MADPAQSSSSHAPATASREALLHLLAEAAELEHNLLCSYLFAAFSLKQDAGEGLRASELAAVRRWREALMAVCIEEMQHLAQVANLAVALGARPHFDRPNLPVPGGYHPAGIGVELRRFDLDTLEHFVFLERGEAAPRVEDSEAVDPPTGYRRGVRPGATLMPAAPDYATVGDFYRLLGDRLADAAGRLGEAALFVGGSARQLRPEELRTPALRVVENLAAAREAIDGIVEQGEGGTGHGSESHFARFTAIRDEYCALRRANPAFEPARPVGPHPVQRDPLADDRTHVTSPAALPLLDAANASYALMLRALTALYDTPHPDAAARGWLLGLAMAAMKLLGALSSRLTREPAQAAGGPHAGVSFAMLRATEGFVNAHCARAALHERGHELLSGTPSTPEAGAQVAEALQGLRDALAAAPAR